MDIKCNNCGADFDSKYPHCPYCGALNYSGAEAQYMEHLEDLKDNLTEMGNDSFEEYTHTMKKGVVIFVTIISILILLTGLFIGLFVMKNRTLEMLGKDKPASDKEIMLWKDKYYPTLDEMYEAKCYDNICDFLEQHSNDTGYAVYDWEHIDFITVYKQHRYFVNEVDADYTTANEAKWTLYDAVYIDKCLDWDYLTYSEEEIEIIKGWQIETANYYHNDLHLTDDQIADMYSQVLRSDSTLPSSDLCKKYLQNQLGYK